EVEDCQTFPHLEQSRSPVRCIAANKLARDERQLERAVTSEIVRTMTAEQRVVGISVLQISKRAKRAGATRIDTETAAPRIRRLVLNAVRGTEGYLSLHGMIVGAIGVCSVRDVTELRIRDDEVCREQTTGSQGSGLRQGALDFADVICSKRARDRYVIAVSDIRSEGRMFAQCFGPGNFRADHADTCTEIQIFQHGVKDGRISAGTRDFQCVEQAVFADFGIVQVIAAG